MAPRPIEEIDFPDLSAKILELLYAIWVFVCDIVLVLSSYVSHAFWAVWTYPPFETFRNEFVAALIALWDYVVVHPITSTAICVLAFIVLPAMLNSLAVCLLGLRPGERGALRGSHVTYHRHYQSTVHGGNVPRGSAPARHQSQDAMGGSGYRVVGSSSWDSA